jgi:hypothetical protein
VIFLGVALAATVAGVFRLLHERQRRDCETEAEKAAAARSRFRALLAAELTSRPLEQVKFAELLADSGVSRDDGDQVADEMFRRLADTFAVDGLITTGERSKLQALARTLEIDRDRADRIEHDARQARYNKAVADAMADGIVTQEEARVLSKLRAQLGVEDSPLAAGDLVSRD